MGFDFPIGLPHEYCDRAGITDFTQILRQLGSGPWADFYEVVCNDWGVSGNYHEFAFGLVWQDDAFWATLAIAIDPGGRSTEPQEADRGTVVRITPGGDLRRTWQRSSHRRYR